MLVIEEINRGGFGSVDKVQTASGHVVARKTFDPTPGIAIGSDLEKLRMRFRREVRVQSSLPGEFFVPVLDSYLEGDKPWFTMPLAECSFFGFAKTGRGTVPSTSDALADIMNSLESLHDLGYTHRDLKPQNVLLHDGHWKLSDLGLVLPPREQTNILTASDSAWGTELYCAPEQVQNFRNATNRADIYSFGCMLHDLFVGTPRVPFQRYTGDGPVGQIIEKCTEVDPNRRFKTIADVRGVLLTNLADSAGNLVASPKAEEWVAKLDKCDDWELSDIEAFARFLRSCSSPDDQWLVCRSLNEKRLQSLFDLDHDLWGTIAESYSEWAKSSFDHRYCDVVIRRLETIFNLGSMDTKAVAVLSAAHLGTSHNSWLVMDRVLSICGSQLVDRVAQRLAIEIVVEQMTDTFRRCAHALDRSIDDYHPSIARVLRK